MMRIFVVLLCAVAMVVVRSATVVSVDSKDTIEKLSPRKEGNYLVVQSVCLTRKLRDEGGNCILFNLNEY